MRKDRTIYLPIAAPSIMLCFYCPLGKLLLFFFFFNDTATTEIYTLSLHDALPISAAWRAASIHTYDDHRVAMCFSLAAGRKSTRLNSSHSQISYAVFCLKKKKTTHSSTLHYT